MLETFEINPDGARRPRPVVSIGEFDGVHRGHRESLDRLRARADQDDAPVGVLTYDRARDGRRLTTLDHRLELLAETGLVDVVWVADTDRDAVPTSRERFVEEVLVDRLGASAVGLDPDARGDWEELGALGARHGFEVLDDPAYAELEELSDRCSATEVSRLLFEGRVADASLLLGRPHEMRGIVEQGDQRGRTLGFPTANLAIPSSLVIPVEGVYAGCYIGDDGIARPAAISLGRRPTFYQEGHELLEAHLIDFDGDLYGQHARVQFVEHLRPQQRFGGIDELVAQLGIDIAATREIFGL
jgi:riboflavin kinase / FMN adenylyltransferase